MRNFIQIGNTISVTAPATVASGDALMVRDLFGIATADAESGKPLELLVAGVVRVPATGTILKGDLVYWDGSAVTTDDDSGANPRVGHATTDKLGDDTCHVRLAP